MGRKISDCRIPPIPTFEEEIEDVRERATKIVGKVRCPRKFDPVHPLVAKLLAHDEERRRDYIKWNSSYYAPRYDSGVERRRLLIINALFLAAAASGCKPAMSKSKYGQDASSDRDICISIGEHHIYATIEPTKSEKGISKERLRFALGSARERKTASKFWEDDENSLEEKLTDVFVDMLVYAEQSYRDSLTEHREWIIKRKAAAEAEIAERKRKAEEEARALRERRAKERIEKLISEADALHRSDRIRSYADAVLNRATEIPLLPVELERWVTWVRQEADRIDPVRNGTIEQAIKRLSETD